jgi:hypothetical protein
VSCDRQPTKSTNYAGAPIAIFSMTGLWRLRYIGKRSRAFRGKNGVLDYSTRLRRELLLQPRRCGGRGEDLADALVRDRDDPLVGLFAVSQELERVPGPPAEPDRASAVLAIERDVAAGTIDVGDELLPLELHELVDPGTRTVERLDDRAIARLLLDGREQPEELDLFQAPLGPP